MRHFRANGVDGRRRVDAAGARRAFGDDHQLLAGVGRHGERGDVSPSDDRRRLRRGGLDILRVVLTAVDRDQIRDATGDIQLTVEVEPQISRP